MSGVHHIALCRRQRGSGWVIAIRSDGAWRPASASAVQRLEHMIDETIRLMAEHPTADVSFSTRPVSMVMSDTFDTPDRLLTALPRTSMSVLLPERAGADRWVTLWRDPRGGLSTRGRLSRFASKLLADEMRAWFAFWELRDIEKDQIGLPLELWVRRGWHANALLPDDFPEPQSGPIVSPRQLLRAKPKARRAALPAS